jgi:molybdopterin synthase sulfur carrier subunit
MKIHIPTVLYSYTGRQKYVDVNGNTLLQILENLDQNYPGIKFRIINELNEIREHMAIYLNGKIVKDIHVSISDTDKIFITHLLSGG